MTNHDQTNHDRSWNRRRFLKGALTTGVALGAAPYLSTGETRVAMPRKTLGTTGEKIPILLMGGAQKFNPRYDKLLHRAYKEGIDYIDTAITYAHGASHRGVAAFLGQMGDRKKLWITSKAPHNDNRADVAYLEQELERALRELKTDYLDLFFIHSVNDPKYLGKEFIKLGDRAKRRKKIRFFGFSCHDGNVAELLNLAAKRGGIDAVMFRYNFAKYGDKELNLAMDAARKAGIGLIAMKVQNSVPKSAEKVVAFRSRSFTLPQAKLKSVWEDDRIDAAVSQMDNIKKLEENVASAKSPLRLSQLDRNQLERLAAATSSLACQGCSHICEPKAGGTVRIARSLRYLMYAECYGAKREAAELYRALPPEASDPLHPSLSAASDACPQGIPIAARLARARDLLG